MRREHIRNRIHRPTLSIGMAIALSFPAGLIAEEGHTDTPFLPDSPYRVHDPDRPQPPVVDPAPGNVAVRPPSDAIVLFDGTDLEAWTGGPWKVEHGAMEVVPKAGDIKTKESFGDIQLHIEWATPAEVEGNSQGRGNSGVFLMGRYEIQVLDSYENPTYADGSAGAVYGCKPPIVNASRAPGEWQTYDIIWRTPQFEGDRLVRSAIVTVFHNGVLIHDHYVLPGKGHHKKAPVYSPHESIGPIQLQDHKDPVRYRNIWVRRLDPEG
jgi:hypothetical protein